MAGGVGSRFWPVSTTEFPKQFHDMLGSGHTLIQKTFSRLSQLIPVENILMTHTRYTEPYFALPVLIKLVRVLPSAIALKQCDCIFRWSILKYSQLELIETIY